MVTGELKSQIDRIWDSFWSGGISNPLEVMEEITYLLFIKRLDDLETFEENKSRSRRSQARSTDAGLAQWTSRSVQSGLVRTSSGRSLETLPVQRIPPIAKRSPWSAQRV